MFQLQCNVKAMLTGQKSLLTLAERIKKCRLENVCVQCFRDMPNNHKNIPMFHKKLGKIMRYASRESEEVMSCIQLT